MKTFLVYSVSGKTEGKDEEQYREEQKGAYRRKIKPETSEQAFQELFQGQIVKEFIVVEINDNARDLEDQKKQHKKTKDLDKDGPRFS